LAKVFISYRGSDLPEAERLAEEIRRAGHDVWLDEWAIGLGDSIVGRMNEGLRDAGYLLLCYSSSGVESPWMGREWMSYLARQLNGSRCKILPLLLTGGSPPPILDDLKYADLTRDWAAGVAEILKAIH
jgi:hypothetical protein